MRDCRSLDAVYTRRVVTRRSFVTPPAIFPEAPEEYTETVLRFGACYWGDA